MSDWLVVADLTDEPDLRAGLARASAAGLTHVAVAPRLDRPTADLEALADAGVVVWGVRLGDGMDEPTGEERAASLARLRLEIADAAVLGAARVWLRAGAHREDVFVAGCELLAAQAARRMMRLAVEPRPGSLLPDAERALAWLRAREGIDLILPDDERRRAAEAGARLAAVRSGSVLLVPAQSPHTSSSTSSET